MCAHMIHLRPERIAGAVEKGGGCVLYSTLPLPAEVSSSIQHHLDVRVAPSWREGCHTLMHRILRVTRVSQSEVPALPWAISTARSHMRSSSVVDVPSAASSSLGDELCEGSE